MPKERINNSVDETSLEKRAKMLRILSVLAKQSFTYFWEKAISR